jgi:hypothetical protein
MERIEGIEPSSSVWKTEALPLSYIRMFAATDTSPRTELDALHPSSTCAYGALGRAARPECGRPGLNRRLDLGKVVRYHFATSTKNYALLLRGSDPTRTGVCGVADRRFSISATEPCDSAEPEPNTSLLNSPNPSGAGRRSVSPWDPYRLSSCAAVTGLEPVTSGLTIRRSAN